MIRTLLLSGFIALLSGCPPFLAAQTPIDKKLFERAVACIKYFEGWHTARNHPYIGYGHKLLPGERLTCNLSRAQADSLLRADLRKRYVTFRRFGKDALILSEISDNKSYPNPSIILKI